MVHLFCLQVTKLLKPSGYLAYRQVYRSKLLRSAHTVCIYVFCVDLRTNSDYFPVQH